MQNALGQGLVKGLKLLEEVSRQNGAMEVINQMPQICGNIAGEIVKEMKRES